MRIERTGAANAKRLAVAAVLVLLAPIGRARAHRVTEIPGASHAVPVAHPTRRHI